MALLRSMKLAITSGVQKRIGDGSFAWQAGEAFGWHRIRFLPLAHEGFRGGNSNCDDAWHG
eukprot:3435190-Amphidinium_carterae.1